MKKTFALIIFALVISFLCFNCTKKTPSSPAPGDDGSKLMKRADMYNPDGVLQQYILFTYNSAGYMTDSIYYSVTISASPVNISEDTYTYGPNNLTTSTKYYDNGVLMDTFTYTYDGLGRLLSRSYESSYPSSDSDTYEYNSDNLITKDTYTYTSLGSPTSSYTVYAYNASKLTITAKQYNSTDTLTGNTKYIYNTSNNLIEKDYYSVSSDIETLSYYDVYTYSGSMLVNESEYWMNSGTPVQESSDSYTYTASGLMSSHTYSYYSSGVVSDTYLDSWEYNSFGGYTKYTWCDNVSCTYEGLEYDQSGRITKVTNYDSSNAVTYYYIVAY